MESKHLDRTGRVPRIEMEPIGKVGWMRGTGNGYIVSGPQESSGITANDWMWVAVNKLGKGAEAGKRFGRGPVERYRRCGDEVSAESRESVRYEVYRDAVAC